MNAQKLTAFSSSASSGPIVQGQHSDPLSTPTSIRVASMQEPKFLQITSATVSWSQMPLL
jgi:hypothetical protein